MVEVMSFMKIQSGRQPGVEAALRNIPELTALHGVTGAYDLVAVFRAAHAERLGEIFSGPVDGIDGLLEVHSHFVLETWSRP